MPKKHTPSNKVRKRRGRDLDEIQDLLSRPEKLARLIQPDQELPGDGQHHCAPCDRYFIDAATLSNHTRNKVHKKRIKLLIEPAYTQAEADIAGGLNTK